MLHKLKKIRLSAIFVAFLSGISFIEASPPTTKASCPCPHHTKGFSLGLGGGVKFLNLKNISTKNGTQRSGDSFANTSSPVIGIYARKYMPCLLPLPIFWGFEFNYLTDMRKTSIYTNLNSANGANDTGYRYQERWDTRAMLGVQIGNCKQVDFWAQVGLQLTNFDYQGRTTEVGNPTQTFQMDNNYALAPAGGLEVRFSQPNIPLDGVATDFIVGWTAGYRNAFKVIGTTPTNNSFNIAMNSNWSHTFGLKVMFRY